MRDYATTAAGFDLQRTAAATLSGTLQALNACVECCDRHALPGRIALFWEGKDGSRASYTFSELKALSGRFANFLQAQGVRPGDCVAGLLPVDQPRQAPDPAARAEAPGMPQHDGLLRQRMRLRRTFAQALPGFAADPLQPGAGLGAVPALLGIPAEIAEHRAGLYRGQLVLVAEQDQARLRR